MVIFKPGKYLLFQTIKKNAPHISGKVLDVGAGPYKRYANFFSKATKYLTLDINSSFKPDIIAPAENIPLADNSINSIVCTQTLGDVLNPFEVISEFSRILKSGGKVLLTESFINEMHGEPRDYWRFTKFSLQYLFEKNNFEVVVINQIGGFFSVIAQEKIRYLIDRFNLYSYWWGKLFNPIFKIYGRFMIFLDKIDKSKANRKHAIGWCIIAQKK